MTAKDDRDFIRQTFELALKAKNKTSPNPMVGAVIVKNGTIVGKGYHKKAGLPHAEIIAMKNAGEKTRGATLYLSLEPCCHWGRTGPCTEAIIQAGIKRVVFAVKDPNPMVNGKGAAQLRKAGIEVKAGILREEAQKINEVYFKNMKTNLPFVALKIAQTLDGKIATVTGDSRWISGDNSRKFVHRMRSGYDAVMVGSGTLSADNPELTVRHVKGKNPYRIIVTGHPRIDNALNLIRHNADCKTIIATSPEQARKLTTRSRKKSNNLIVWNIKSRGRLLSLSDLLNKAMQFGITSILVEGGAKLATTLIKESLVDKYYIFIAPKIIGKGKDSVEDIRIRKMQDALEFSDISYDGTLAPDMLFVGYPKRKGKI